MYLIDFDGNFTRKQRIPRIIYLAFIKKTIQMLNSIMQKKRLIKVTLSLLITIIVSLSFNTQKVFAAYGYNDFQYVDSWSGWSRTAFPSDTKTTGNGKYLSFTMHNVDQAIMYVQWSSGNIYADRDGNEGLGLSSSNLDEILKGRFDPEALYMFLDFGYFTEYIPQLKDLGYISPSYKSPLSFYVMTAKRDYTQFSWAGYDYEYSSDCDFINQYNSASDKKAFIKSTEYIPKFVLEQKGSISANTDVVTSATTYDGVDYSSEFDAQYYYDNNPDLQRAIGSDGQKLLEHYVKYGKTEGRRGRA